MSYDHIATFDRNTERENKNKTNCWKLNQTCKFKSKTIILHNHLAL